MARTYTFEEAVKIIFENEDKEAMVDMARRFPLATMKIVEMVTMTGEKFVEFASMVPSYITMSKVNSTAKNSVANDTDETDAENETEEVDVKEPVKEPANVEKKNRGRKAKVKEEKPVEDEGEDDEESTEKDPYEGKNAVELYKMCKERGLNVKSRLKASEYVKALKEDDAKAAKVEEADDDDDGWEDNEPEEKPVKTAKKEKKKAKQVEEDEDDDWDI